MSALERSMIVTIHSNEIDTIDVHELNPEQFAELILRLIATHYSRSYGTVWLRYLSGNDMSSEILFLDSVYLEDVDISLRFWSRYWLQTQKNLGLGGHTKTKQVLR